MNYRELQPHPHLASYIDAYWVVQNNGAQPVCNRIMPDGCVDIIFNVGEDFLTDNGKCIMKSETPYLVGTMTSYKDVIRTPGTHLIGIRFRPAAFSFFFSYAGMHEIVNQTVAFEKKWVPVVHPGSIDLQETFNRFLLNRIDPPRQALFPVIDDIQRCCGQVSVEALAKKHFMSVRRLERLFKQHIGTSPKAFINFIRYQFALQNIRKFQSQKSLLEIAFESGYYDHAHLTNEFRKYAGLTPSEL